MNQGILLILFGCAKAVIQPNLMILKDLKKPLQCRYLSRLALWGGPIIYADIVGAHSVATCFSQRFEYLRF